MIGEPAAYVLEGDGDEEVMIRDVQALSRNSGISPTGATSN